MRIAILTSSYPRFNGDTAAPFVKSIAEALASQGNSIEVIAPFDPEVRKYVSDRVIVHWFKYFPLKSTLVMGHGRALQSDVRLQPLAYIMLPFYLFGAFCKLWQVTGQQKTDVIHVHWVLPNGPVAAIVAGLRGIPFIISLHGSDIYIARKKRYFGMVAAWVFHQATGVTACSSELKLHAEQLGARNTVHLIPWGADPNVFKPSENRQALRAKYKWEDKVVIISLGRLVYKKGFQILIQAFSSIRAKHTRVMMIIGGDGPLASELNTLAQSLGISDSIDFIGRIPWYAVPELLAAADIFVLPSVRDAYGNLDGLPTVLLEAMGCGLATIASDIGGVPLVIRDHENGLLVASGSADEISNRLELLLNDEALRKKLGNAARKSIEDELNWDMVAKQLLNILSGAL